MTPGALVLHGFGGSPASVGPLLDALHAAGFATAAPCLPGHGTVVEDLVPVRWADLTAASAASYDDVAIGGGPVVVVGQSMGAALACWLAARRPVSGLVVVNPLVAPDPELVNYLGMLLEAGETVLPAGPPDIADPDAVEDAYDATPLATLRSVHEGVVALQADLAAVTCPVLVATSTVDHVVDRASSDHLAASVTGPVTRLALPRSFHVAALDLDRELLGVETVAFARRVIDLDRSDGGGQGGDQH